MTRASRIISKKIQSDEGLFYSWREFSRIQIALVCLIAFLYTWLRFEYQCAHSFDGDQAVTIKGLSLNFFDWLFRYIPETDFHFPGAYVPLYPIGHWISQDRYLLMTPYALLSLLFYVLFAKLNWYRFMNIREKKYVIDSKYVNILACALLACNNTQIIHAFELRPYTLLSLLFLSALLLAKKTFATGRFNWKLSLGFLLICLFHNFGILMVLIGFGYVCCNDLLSKGWRKSLDFFAAHYPLFFNVILALVIAAPFIWSYTHRPVLGLFAKSIFNVHEYIDSGMKGVVQVCAILFGFSSDFKIVRLVVILLSSIGILIHFYEREFKPFLFAFFLVAMPIMIIFVFDVKTQYWFIQRQFIWTIPFHAVFIGIMTHSGANYLLIRFKRINFLVATKKGK